MKASTFQEGPSMNLDPASFLADPELIRALSQHATPVPCEAERLLFHQDDPAVGVYILHEGSISLSMISPSGQSLVNVQALVGSLLGLPALISNKPYSLTAVAHAGSQVSFVSRAEFIALMQSDPQLSFKILKILAAEVRSARRAVD